MSIYFLNNDVAGFINYIKSHPDYLNDLSSYEVYRLLLFVCNNKDLYEYIIKEKKVIFEKICYNFGFYDALSLLLLLRTEGFKEEAKAIFEETIKKTFSNETIFFLNKINNKIKTSDVITRELITNETFKALGAYDNEKASIIVYNLYILLDFRTELKKRFKIVEKIIELYQLYDPKVVASNIFKGASIIGCLLKDNNQYLAEECFELVSHDKDYEDVSMIGGGGSSLVFKANDEVLKLGETRNCRSIYINHRILASKIRKLLKNKDKELFYVEVMKYISCEGITEEDVEELKNDLYRQGLIWDDTKLANCGLLPDGYDNECDLPVDYEEVAGRIDNPYYKEEFMKRTRRVVVLDNDDIRMNPKSLWK